MSGGGGFAQPAPGYGSAVNVIVVNESWAHLQPTTLGTPTLSSEQAIAGTSTPPGTGTNLIEQAIAYVRSHPGLNYCLKLRIYCGIFAPAWAQAISDPSGSLAAPFTIQDGNFGTTGSMGAWWTSTYVSCYANFMVQLAAVYDAVPEIRDVCISGASTIYPEPLLRQVSAGSGPHGYNFPTISNLIQAGYTTAADQAALQASIDDYFAAWRLTSGSFSFNPYQTIGASSGPAPFTPTSAALNSITKTGAGWTVNAFAGGAVYDITGAVSYAIVSNGTQVLTLSGGVTPNATHQYVAVLTSVDGTGGGTYNGQLISYGRATYGQRFVAANNSFRDGYGPASGDSYGTMYGNLAAAGPPLCLQTSVATKINGPNPSTLTAMNDAMASMLPLGVGLVELPGNYSGAVKQPGYFNTFSGTTGAGTTGSTVNDSGSPGWAAAANPEWGNGGGQYGKVTFTTSGNSYWVSANTTSSLTIAYQVGVPGQTTLLAADAASGLAYTVTTWCYLSVGDMSEWAVQFSGNPTCGSPASTGGRLATPGGLRGRR